MIDLTVIDITKNNLICTVDDQSYFKVIKLKLEGLSSSSQMSDSTIEAFIAEIIYQTDPFCPKKILLSLINSSKQCTIYESINLFTKILSLNDIRLLIHPDLKEELDSQNTPLLYDQIKHDFSNRKLKFRYS